MAGSLFMAVYRGSSRRGIGLSFVGNTHISYNHLMSARTPSGVAYREVGMFIPWLLSHLFFRANTASLKSSSIGMLQENLATLLLTVDVTVSGFSADTSET